MFAQITSVFWSGMLRCSVSAPNFVLCYLSYGALQLLPRKSEIGFKQTSLMCLPAFANLAVFELLLRSTEKLKLSTVAASAVTNK